MSVFKDMVEDESVLDSVPNPQQQLNSPKPKTFQQWQNIRRSMASKYYTPRVQLQMQRDCAALGHAFFDDLNEE
jgi:hypothetical protein